MKSSEPQTNCLVKAADGAVPLTAAVILYPRPVENSSLVCSRLNCSFTLAEWSGLMIGYTGLRREIWSFTALMEILIKS